MPSEQKTISIDPDLFVNTEKTKGISTNRNGSHRETLKRPKKIKPKMPKGTSSNTLRKNLLARIKEHQMREQKEYKKKAREDNELKNNQKQSKNSDFDDEFSKSLAYLSELARTTELARLAKKQKRKNNLTLKTSGKTSDVRVRPHMDYHAKLRNFTPEVKLEMPSELQEPIFEVKVLPSKESTKKEDEHTKAAMPINDVQAARPLTMTKDVPYGIMRGGNKPTYREYTRKLSGSTSTKTPLTIHNYTRPQVQSVREKMLSEIKEKQKLESKPSVSIPLTKQKRMKTIKRTTSKRRFKLGKDGKKRIISVLVKNNATRRQVKLELGRLKSVPIKDVRLYLKRHGLLKVGSMAPPDVLRKIYEQSILSGDIHNTAKETLIHNFLNDKEPSW